MSVSLPAMEFTPALRTTVLPQVLEREEYLSALQRTARWEAWRASERERYERAKRLLDVLVAATALVLLAPLLVVLACLIVLEDGGPVLYRRTMVGRDGRPFAMAKLRTMAINADALLSNDPNLSAEFRRQGFKLRNDPRVTRIGRVLRRHSLDELPQLWHVLTGEMSLVGPRCMPAWELEAFGETATLRQSVQPGITGLWQVSGRSDTSLERRIRLDREYVRTCSLRRDLEILLRTVGVVAHGSGAY